MHLLTLRMHLIGLAEFYHASESSKTLRSPTGPSKSIYKVFEIWPKTFAAECTRRDGIPVFWHLVNSEQLPLCKRACSAGRMHSFMKHRVDLRISSDSYGLPSVFARGLLQDFNGFVSIIALQLFLWYLLKSLIEVYNDSVFASSWPFTLALNSCTTPSRISMNFHRLSLSCSPLFFPWFSLISGMILDFCCPGRIHSHETVVKHTDLLILRRIPSVARYTRFVAGYTRFVAGYTRWLAVYTRSPAA
jgi:hypothetical protein